MLTAIETNINALLIRVMDVLFKPVNAGWSPKGGSNKDLNTLIKTGLNLALIGAGVIAVAYLIWSGIKYIMAGGDAGKAKEAQHGITNAVIGLVVALAAFVLVQFIFSALGTKVNTDITDFS